MTTFKEWVCYLQFILTCSQLQMYFPEPVALVESVLHHHSHGAISGSQLSENQCGPEANGPNWFQEHLRMFLELVTAWAPPPNCPQPWYLVLKPASDSAGERDESIESMKWYSVSVSAFTSSATRQVQCLKLAMAHIKTTKNKLHSHQAPRFGVISVPFGLPANGSWAARLEWASSQLDQYFPWVQVLFHAWNQRLLTKDCSCLKAIRRSVHSPLAAWCASVSPNDYLVSQWIERGRNSRTSTHASWKSAS